MPIKDTPPPGHRLPVGLSENVGMEACRPKEDKMRIEHGALVLVADAAKMLLLRNEGDRRYAVLETMASEVVESQPSRELGSDRPGRVHASVGDRSSAYGDTDWHRQSGDEFARHVAVMLEEAAGQQPDVDIVVVAAPRTLSELRKHYGRETRRRLVGEIPKDLAGHVTDDIIDTISAHPG